MNPFQQLQKMIEKKQKDLFKQINKDYRETIDLMETEIEKIVETAEYDEKGNLLNEKEINQKLKTMTPIIVALWLKNKSNIETTSKDMMKETTLFYEFISVKQLGNTRVIQTVPEINKTISKILKERSNTIKWNQVINGNAKTLDKRLQNIIKKDIAKGKTKFQIERDLQTQMRLNSGKARTIARTESNYYYSKSKYETGKLQEESGNIMVKIWEYTYLSKEPRDSHEFANGQIVEGVDTKFIVGGLETVAPQQFGIAGEDINCNCQYTMRYKEGTNLISYVEYGEYKAEKEVE